MVGTRRGWITGRTLPQTTLSRCLTSETWMKVLFATSHIWFIHLEFVFVSQIVFFSPFQCNFLSTWTPSTDNHFLKTNFLRVFSPLVIRGTVFMCLLMPYIARFAKQRKQQAVSNERYRVLDCLKEHSIWHVPRIKLHTGVSTDTQIRMTKMHKYYGARALTLAGR